MRRGRQREERGEGTAKRIFRMGPWLPQTGEAPGRPVHGQRAPRAQKAPISVAQERHSRAAPTLSAGPCAAAPSTAGAA